MQFNSNNIRPPRLLIEAVLFYLRFTPTLYSSRRRCPLSLRHRGDCKYWRWCSCRYVRTIPGSSSSALFRIKVSRYKSETCSFSIVLSFQSQSYHLPSESSLLSSVFCGYHKRIIRNDK